jgi:hypothetical protein
MAKAPIPLLAAVVALALPLAASAQDVAQPELESRLVNLPTHRVLTLGTWQLIFTHRFVETLSQGGSTNLYGLDSGADIGLGLALGLGGGVDVEVYRATLYKELEASVKWCPLRQGRAFPLGVAVRAGADYRGVPGISDRWAGFAQLVLARRVGGRLDLFAVPTFVSDTPTLRNAFNVGLGGAAHFARAWDVSLELMPANRDVPGSRVAWALGFTKRIRGHSFLIYLGNSRATTTDLIAGSDLPGGFKADDARLGFNLVRRFPE